MENRSKRRLIKSTPNAPLLIGLCAPAMGSGKTTVAKHLQASHGFERVCLASPLKEMAITLLCCAGSGLSYYDALEIITDPELKETNSPSLNGKSPRYIMQTIGTEWGRDCLGEDFWINIALAKARREITKGNPVVIDDVRFPNEAKAIENAGGIMGRVVRPQAGITSPHASEGLLDDYPVNFLIENSWSLEALKTEADFVIAELMNIPHTN